MNQFKDLVLACKHIEEWLAKVEYNTIMHEDQTNFVDLFKSFKTN